MVVQPSFADTRPSLVLFGQFVRHLQNRSKLASSLMFDPCFFCFGDQKNRVRRHILENWAIFAKMRVRRHIFRKNRFFTFFFTFLPQSVNPSFGSMIQSLNRSATTCCWICYYPWSNVHVLVTPLAKAYTFHYARPSAPFTADF